MVKKEVLKRLDLKKIIKKIAEIKDIVESPSLNYRETIKKLKKIIKIKGYDAYKPKRLVVLLVIILWNIKVMVIEIDQYQLLDILMILENI